jgi:hypothetical protein
MTPDHFSAGSAPGLRSPSPRRPRVVPDPLVLGFLCGLGAAASPRRPSWPPRRGSTGASASPGSGWRSSPPTSRRSGSRGGPTTASNSVFPGTAATGPMRMPNKTRGTTASSWPTNGPRNYVSPDTSPADEMPRTAMRPLTLHLVRAHRKQPASSRVRGARIRCHTRHGVGDWVSLYP